MPLGLTGGDTQTRPENPVLGMQETPAAFRLCVARQNPFSFFPGFWRCPEPGFAGL
jgi:hypothetical protein